MVKKLKNGIYDILTRIQDSDFCPMLLWRFIDDIKYDYFWDEESHTY
jgi:hypothetical protein